MDYFNLAVFKPIGKIYTPYTDNAPYQPPENSGAKKKLFFIEIDPQYQEGLKDLERFHYVYILFHLHRMTKKTNMRVTPPWSLKSKGMGLFATRSPSRPNPIGLSTVALKKVEGRKIYTGSLDIFNETPLLDIKPYIKSLDNRQDANDGWLDDEKGKDSKEHIRAHIEGRPHTH